MERGLLEGTDSMGSPDPIPAGDLSAFEPSTISAEDLHRQASFARAFENSWRLRLAFILLAFRESRLHNHLGSSSVEAYAEKHFRLDHRTTREMVRVAEALRELPRLREAYLMGRLDWSLVVELIRVVKPDTEEEWLAFAEKKPVRAIKLEIENALEKKRKRPRAWLPADGRTDGITAKTAKIAKARRTVFFAPSLRALRFTSYA